MNTTLSEIRKVFILRDDKGNTLQEISLDFTEGEWYVCGTWNTKDHGLRFHHADTKEALEMGLRYFAEQKYERSMREGKEARILHEQLDKLHNS